MSRMVDTTMAIVIIHRTARLTIVRPDSSTVGSVVSKIRITFYILYVLGMAFKGLRRCFEGYFA